MRDEKRRWRRRTQKIKRTLILLLLFPQKITTLPFSYPIILSNTTIMFRSSVTRTCRIWSKTLAEKAAPAGRQAPLQRSYHVAAAATAARSNTSNMFPTKTHLTESRRTVFIQTESTPNPESLKFVPTGKTVLESEDGTGFFVSKTDAIEEIAKSPLAKALFKVEGVKAVYLGNEFVTITKYAEGKWQLLRPDVFAILMDFFDSDKPVLLEHPEITDTTILEDDDEIVAMIKELIEARIRPAVQEDGGDIRYEFFDEETGMVTVRLAGSCAGCPSSSVTLKTGVENMLMHYIPEVTGVQSVDEDETEGAGEEEEQPAEVQKTYEQRLAAAGIPFSE
jgi:Fe-S cluster biogenesis protein NfuA